MQAKLRVLRFNVWFQTQSKLLATSALAMYSKKADLTGLRGKHVTSLLGLLSAFYIYSG